MPNKFVVASGGSLETAVDAMMAHLRHLWNYASKPSHWIDDGLLIPAEEVTGSLKTFPLSAANYLEGAFGTPAANGKSFNSGDLSYQSVVHALFGESVPSPDLRHLALRSIRRKYHVRLSSAVVEQLQAVARTVANLLDGRPGQSRFPQSDFGDQIGANQTDSERKELIRAYIEAGFVLGYLLHSGDFQSLTVLPQAADTAYLLSNLFGLPTSIRGFDDLFGGGGLMLLDAIPSAAEARESDPWTLQSINSRIVLTIGPFGSGKSLLSLQMAVEVARKGGLAWVMALEQSEEECLYSLNAIGVSTSDESFDVVRGSGRAFMALSSRSPRKGCLLFIRPEEESWEKFIPYVMTQLSWMKFYSLRLLVIDPVDALILERKAFHLRSETRRLFDEAKKEKVNIWLTSERPHGRDRSNDFAENIADTVIRLGVESDPGSQRRFIQVTKSRLQGEQAGHHAMTIEGGRGIRIDTSSSSPQRLTAAPSRCLEPRGPLQFGVPGVRDLLGMQDLQPGDIVALVGPGKSKTLLGAEFLRAPGQSHLAPEGQSVFISDYTPDRIRRFLGSLFPKHWASDVRRFDQVRYCSVSPGYVDPGRILQDIQDVFERCCTLKGSAQADRVLITNLARWEQEMPLLAHDFTFAVALVNLLRQYQVVTVIVCGDDPARGKSRLRDIIFDSSDFLLEFTRVESRGVERTFVRAVKTRFMRHPRIVFELLVEDSGLSLVPAPMLNVSPDGQSHPVRIRLFLHSETTDHKRYNAKLAGALRTSVSSETSIAKQTENYDPTIFGMTRLSAVNELQIIQLDEFQLPDARNLLAAFPAERGRDLLDGRLPDLLDNVSSAEGNSFVAVPFYENISFLAHRLPALPPSWEELAEMCEAQEPKLDKDEVFFSCPVYERGVETYSCLFLEILQTIVPQPAGPEFTLLHWVSDPKAVDAARLFRSLCYRSHVVGYRKHVKPNAQVSRHWYNTLNQELSDSDPDKRAGLQVSALYGNVTTAGEWYLAIPAYSASPDVGLEIIRNLTTPSREMERLYLGVGLPTRLSFYENGKSADSAGNTATSRYFRFPHDALSKLIRPAIRRSRLRGYQRFSNTLVSHLLWLVEIPGSMKDPKVQKEVEGVVASLVSSMKFLQNSFSGPVGTAG